MTPVVKRSVGSYSIVARRRLSRDDEPTAVTRMYEKVREEQQKLKAKTARLASQADELVNGLESEEDKEDEESEDSTVIEGE